MAHAYDSYADAPPPREEAIWTCRDGRQIAVKDMDADHIRNALGMLRRKGVMSAAEKSDYFRNPPSGELAYDAWASEIDQVILAPTSPFIEIFERELVSRGEEF